MARSFSTAKAASAFISNEISALATRRGYAAAAPGAASSGGVRSGAPRVMLKQGSEETGKTAWVPDPKTGYYQPENAKAAQDPVVLREALLKNKTGKQ